LSKKRPDEGVEKIRRRVEAIIKVRPSYREVLELFKDVATEQYLMRSKIKTAPVEIEKENLAARMREGFPLVEKQALTLDIPSVTRLFKRLCKLLSHHKKASADCEQITHALNNKKIDLLELFKQIDLDNKEYITDLSKKIGVKDGVLEFVARNSLRPIFEAYAENLKDSVDQEIWWRGYCPICGSGPFLAEFKNEGARFLLCSSCGYEWRFMRLKCPFCENDDHERLGYFYTEKEEKTYRVDVCEKCERYIKTVDIRDQGEDIIPVIEDVGTFHLDILAQKAGYKRETAASGLQVHA